MATHEKDPAHVEAGKKAAETRKQHEGADVFHEMGKKAAHVLKDTYLSSWKSSSLFVLLFVHLLWFPSFIMATHEKDPAHVEAGKKAAETLKQEYGQDVYHKLGHMGGLAAAEASHERARQSDDGKDPIRVEAGKHAAETRKEHEGPDVFQKMGHMGGEAAHHHAGTAHGSGGHGHTTGHAAAHGTAHGAGHGTETEKDPIRVEAGKHAAETRKEHEGQDAFQQMCHMGGLAAAKASHQRALESDDGKDPSRVEAGKHAAETRKEHEGPDVFQKMGEKGAQAHWHPEQGK